eukprot:6177782-Pleurochrysis_carterae.AAC.2
MISNCKRYVADGSASLWDLPLAPLIRRLQAAASGASLWPWGEGTRAEGWGGEVACVAACSGRCGCELAQTHMPWTKSYDSTALRTPQILLDTFFHLCVHPGSCRSFCERAQLHADVARYSLLLASCLLPFACLQEGVGTGQCGEKRAGMKLMDAYLCTPCYAVGEIHSTHRAHFVAQHFEFCWRDASAVVGEMLEPTRAKQPGSHLQLARMLKFAFSSCDDAHSFIHRTSVRLSSFFAGLPGSQRGVPRAVLHDSRQAADAAERWAHFALALTCYKLPVRFHTA